MKKVLIIGSQGMLGQELVAVFAKDKKYQVTAWDFAELDVTDAKQVAQKIGALQPDLIFNATAYNAVDKCETDKLEYAKAKKLNSVAPGTLAKVAKKLEATLVHYSTDYVFGGGMPELSEPLDCTGSCAGCNLHAGFVPELGFFEESAPAPLQKYGQSKLLGELNVQKVGGKFYILRLSKLFGKPAKAAGAKRSFFDVMLELVKTQKEIKVVDEEISGFTYAPDLAKLSKRIVETGEPYGIYHAANSGACTWHAAAVELFKLAKKRVKVVAVSSEEFPRPATRPYVSTLFNTKLKPQRRWQSALKEYLKQVKN